MAATKTSKKASEPNRPEATKSASDIARDLSAPRPLASTQVPTEGTKGEWPVPPNTVAPPNEKVDGRDVTKLDQGLDDFTIDNLDGAKVVVRLGKEERLVDQADLHRVAKVIAKGIQVSY